MRYYVLFSGFLLKTSKMICQWGEKNNPVSVLIKIIFLTPLADHFTCFKQKLFLF